MKIRTLLLGMLFVPALMQVQTKDSKGQHALLQQSEAELPLSNHHPLAQWFPNAGLGLFVHLGMSSVHGSIYLS